MKLDQKQQATEVLNLSELIVEEEMCINLRGRMEHCSACADTCPSEALTLTVDSVELNKDKCTGCNSCLPSCAAGALRSSGFVPERFLSTLAGQKQVQLHCRGSRSKGGGVVIPCFNVLDARLLASIRSEGFDELFLHGLDRCPDCELGDARRHVKDVEKIARDWMGEDAPRLDTTGSNSAEKQGIREYQDQAHLDRRSFLRLGGAKTVHHVANWFVPALMDDEEDEEELLPFYQADDFPQRPAAYAAALLKRINNVPWVSDQNPPWRVRHVSEDCSGCLSCGERCPTGALNAEETTGARKLSFDPAICTDCKLCEMLCPENAMIPGDATDIDAVLAGRSLLMHMRQKECAQCGSTFIPQADESDICPVCSNEQDLDDEWMDMLSG